MASSGTHKPPPSGLAGFQQTWRYDLTAAFSVAMVALPLSLGVASASGLIAPDGKELVVPPIAGMVSAIIGGLVTTFFRSSKVAINGPSAGLITVIAGALLAFHQAGAERPLDHVMAVVVVAGFIQVVIGLLRLGRYGESIPASVIQGVLAAIGIIILGKELHRGLGLVSESQSAIGALIELPESLLNANPFVAMITIGSLLILIFYPKIKNKFFHYIPAPMWVLVLAVPMVLFFNFLNPHTETFWGASFHVGPEFLIKLPDNMIAEMRTAGYPFPDFSMIGSLIFWPPVIGAALISSIETVASARAVEKLDPYKRPTSLNREVIAVGASTMVAGFLGGLPVVTVIARSSVNIHNGARSKASNFMHGIMLLMVVLLAAPVIREIPRAALAAILIYTGYKLAAPKIFRKAWEQGWDQLLFLLITLITTLVTDLLFGILAGVLAKIIVQWLRTRLPLSIFLKYSIDPEIRLKKEEKRTQIQVKGLGNFFTLMKLKKVLRTVPESETVVVDFAHSRLVDLTTLEQLQEMGSKRRRAGGSLRINGLERHRATSDHPQAVRTRVPQRRRLGVRSRLMHELAAQNGWAFEAGPYYDSGPFPWFHYFESRPVEHRSNIISGKMTDMEVHWEMCDLVFEEGALHAAEAYRTTTEIVDLPFELPPFLLKKEDILDRAFDRLRKFTGYQDIDFEVFPGFSKKFILEGPDEAALRKLFQPDLLRFLENADIYHVECNGQALLIFRRLRLAKEREIESMHAFTRELVRHLAGEANS